METLRAKRQSELEQAKKELGVGDQEVYAIIYDTVERRPGCVLLQAALGGNVPNFEGWFDVHSWLVDLTPNMKRLPITLEKMPKLAQITRDARNGRY